jgi:hypothetical protein
MTLDLALWIAAVVCWGLAAFVQETFGRVNMTALGLALAGLTFIV